MSRGLVNRLSGTLILIAAGLVGLLGAPWMPHAAAMPIERVTGSRGVEAWLVEDHSIPVVTLRFAVPGGHTQLPANRLSLP